MRRDAGRHTDRDTFGAVDQQIREAGRQNGRLLVLAIVVVLKIDGFFIDIADHFHRQRRHLTFGVTGCCGAKVTRRTEVTLTGNQRIAQRPPLHQTCQRIVDRGIAVRVVVTHDVADDAGRLGEGRSGSVSAVVHRVEHATVNRLEAVTHVGEGSTDDNAHRVVEVGALHFYLQVNRQDTVVVNSRVGCVV